MHSELEELIHSKVRVSRSLQTTDEIGLDTVGSKFQQMFDGEIGQALAFQAFDELDTDAVTLEFDQLVNREVCVAQATELTQYSHLWSECLPAGWKRCQRSGSAWFHLCLYSADMHKHPRT